MSNNPLTATLSHQCVRRLIQFFFVDCPVAAPEEQVTIWGPSTSNVLVAMDLLDIPVINIDYEDVALPATRGND